MKTIGTATLGVIFALTAIMGCDKIRAIRKAAEGASTATAVQEAVDPDDALSEKLGEYINCLNYATKSVSYSRGQYFGWVDEKTGPTGKERSVGGLPAIDADNCLKSIDKAKTLPPTLPEVEAAAAAYKTALEELVPIADTAHKYYSQNDYKDDKLAKGKQMHAQIVAGFAKFRTADKSFDGIVTGMNEALSARQLQKLAKDPAARLHYLTKQSLAQAKVLVNAADIAQLKDLDAAKYQAALENFEKANTELETYTASHKAEVDKVSLFSSFVGDQEKFLKAAKDLMRRKRDNKDFNKETFSDRNPELVEGHPAQVTDKYNRMIGSSNSLHF